MLRSGKDCEPQPFGFWPTVPPPAGLTISARPPETKEPVWVPPQWSCSPSVRLLGRSRLPNASRSPETLVVDPMAKLALTPTDPPSVPVVLGRLGETP